METQTFGSTLLICSIYFLLQLWLKIKFSVCMEVSRQILTLLTK